MKKIIAVCLSVIMIIFIMPVNTEQTVLADTANEICNDCHEEIYSHDFIQYEANQTVTCPTCNGKYWVKKSEPCAHCNGTGKYTVNMGGSPCYGCSGKGTVPVYSTDANGNKIFKGNTACSVCRGTGSSPDNYVTNNCAYCNGSGLFYYNEVCPMCNGTGKITVTITTAPKITTNKIITTTTAKRVSTTPKKVTTTTRKATTTTRKVTTTTKRATTTTKKTTTTTTTSSKSKTNTTTAIQPPTTTIRTLPTLENDYDTFILLDLESGKYTIPFDSTGLTYKSTNPQVATVSNTGIITPVSVGTATITATNSKGKTATFSISVVQIATLTPKITTTVTTKKLTSTTTTSKTSTTTSTSQTTTTTSIKTTPYVTTYKPLTTNSKVWCYHCNIETIIEDIGNDKLKCQLCGLTFNKKSLDYIEIFNEPKYGVIRKEGAAPNEDILYRYPSNSYAEHVLFGYELPGFGTMGEQITFPNYYPITILGRAHAIDKDYEVYLCKEYKWIYAEFVKICDYEIVLGDVNNDSSINAVDASTVLSYYAMVSTNKDGGLDDNQKAAADVDKNSLINAVDASCILSYYAFTATGGKLSLIEFLKSQNTSSISTTTTTYVTKNTTTTSTKKTTTTQKPTTTTTTSTTTTQKPTTTNTTFTTTLIAPNVKCYFCDNQFFTSGVGSNGVKCGKCKKYFLPNSNPNESDKSYAVKYPGIWHISNVDNHELVIHVMNSSNVTFSYMSRRGLMIKSCSAMLEGNIAHFITLDYTEGYLTFNDNSISLKITKMNGASNELTEEYTLKDLNSFMYNKQFSDIDDYYYQMNENISSGGKCLFCGSEYYYTYKDIVENCVLCCKCDKYYLPTENSPSNIDILYASKYPGVWHSELTNEHEIIIHVLNSKQVVFSIGFYRIWGTDFNCAYIDNKTASFTSNDGNITGTLTFEEDSIILTFTKSIMPDLKINSPEKYSINDLYSFEDNKQYANVEQINTERSRRIQLLQ